MQQTDFLDFHKASNKEKESSEYGLMIGRNINQTLVTGFGGYYNVRNSRFYANRKIAAGQQDMQQFLDLMEIDGKQSYINLDMTPPKIAPKFMEIIVQRFMERDEKLSCNAMDTISMKRKTRGKDEAEFRMNNAEMIAAVEQQSGMPVEDKNAFTPRNRDELEYYFGYEFQLPEEIGFEKGINAVLVDNDWMILKRMGIEDCSETGLLAFKVYVDPMGKIRIRRVQPENLFYSWSAYDDFRDASWMGELYKMKVTEYRTLFWNDYVREYGAQNAEKKLFEDVQKAQSDRVKLDLAWTWDYMYNYFRPYDDWTVDVLDFEFKTVDNDIYVAKKNERGRLVDVQKKSKRPERLGDKKELINKQLYNIYHGYYVRKIDKVFCWGKAKNMIRPQSNLSDVFFSYTVHMFRNRNMMNVALPERIAAPVTAMTLTLLKIQQLKAKMRPAGISVDIKGLSGIDLLGSGNPMEPLEIQKIYDQTGNIYWKSWDEDPTNIRPIEPIRELSNAGSVAQLQQLVADYNFQLSILRDTIGTNEFSEGSGQVSGKTSPTLAQNQVQSANRATEFIYDSYMNVFKGVGRRIAILLWDNIMYGGQEYRDFVGQDKLDSMRFDIDIEPMQTAEDKLQLNQNINTALEAGLITFLDAEKVRNISNTKLAYMYLQKALEDNRQKNQQDQLAMVQATSQAQMASAKATSEAKIKENSAKGESEAQVEYMKAKSSSELSLQDFVQKLLLTSFEADKPLTPELQGIVDSFFNGKARQEMAEQQMMGQMMQAAAQQQGTPPQEGGMSPEESEEMGSQMTDEL